MSDLDVAYYFNRMVSDLINRVRNIDASNWFMIAICLFSLFYLFSGLGQIDKED